MATRTKAKTAPKARPAKRKAASKSAATKAATAAAKKPRAAKARPSPKPRASASSGFDLGKIIDHPLVADLLAVGAMAAVAAIADHSVKSRTGEAEKGSSKAVKAAGKAAAAAIGKRLMTEAEAIRSASKPKETRRGSK